MCLSPLTVFDSKPVPRQAVGLEVEDIPTISEEPTSGWLL